MFVSPSDLLNDYRKERLRWQMYPSLWKDLFSGFSFRSHPILLKQKTRSSARIQWFFRENVITVFSNHFSGRLLINYKMRPSSEWSVYFVERSLRSFYFKCSNSVSYILWITLHCVYPLINYQKKKFSLNDSGLSISLLGFLQNKNSASKITLSIKRLLFSR